MEDALLSDVSELLPKALKIAERVFIDKTDESEEFQERVLQRGRSLVRPCSSQFIVV
jgi:hypothetical protein